MSNLKSKFFRELDYEHSETICFSWNWLDSSMSASKNIVTTCATITRSIHIQLELIKRKWIPLLFLNNIDWMEIPKVVNWSHIDKPLNEMSMYTQQSTIVTFWRIWRIDSIRNLILRSLILVLHWQLSKPASYIDVSLNSFITCQQRNICPIWNSKSASFSVPSQQFIATSHISIFLFYNHIF